jgi:hypothetical protein
VKNNDQTLEEIFSYEHMIANIGPGGETTRGLSINWRNLGL